MPPRRRRRKREQHFDDVAQFLERLDQHDAGALDLEPHHRVIARHRAGMRRGGFARRARAAGMQQHDRLAAARRPRRRGEEARGLAELLDDHRDHARVGIVDQIVDIILDPARRLVAGRYRKERPRPRLASVTASTAAIAPTARRCRRPAAPPSRSPGSLDEGQRNAVDDN